MRITIAARCSSFFNSWLAQSYSPNLTNADKMLANLKRIGQIDREEWSNSFDIICNALELYDLTLLHEMTIENMRFGKECNLIIDTSFTMLDPDEDPLYASFILDNTLNILEEAKENNAISKFKLDIALYNQETATNVDELLSDDDIENIQPETHPNVKDNISNTFSKSYHSLPFFLQLCSPTAAANSSVNEHLAEQLTRSPTPGLVKG